MYPKPSRQPRVSEKKASCNAATFNDGSSDNLLQPRFSPRLGAERPISASTTGEVSVGVFPIPRKEVLDPDFSLHPDPKKEEMYHSKFKRPPPYIQDLFQSRRHRSKASARTMDKDTHTTSPKHMDIPSGAKKRTPLRNKSPNAVSSMSIFFCVCLALSILTNIVFMTLLSRNLPISHRLCPHEVMDYCKTCIDAARNLEAVFA